MKNEQIVRAFDFIAPSVEAKARVWEKACQKQPKKNAGLKLAGAVISAAAVFCLVFFGGPLLQNKNEENLFTITAYALSQGEDGTFQLTEVDLLEESPQDWGGFIDWENTNLYVGLGFKFDGVNLASAEVTTDNGFFARQYIGKEASGAVGPDLILIGSANHPFVYGNEFDIIGDTINLDRESLNDYLYFWGTSYEVPAGEDQNKYGPPFPEELSLRILTVMENGESVEQDVDIALSDKGATIFFKSTPELEEAEDQALLALSELQESISLDECVLDIERTYQLTYGDTFEYLAHCSDEYNSFTINEETPALLDSFGGRLRISSYLPVDGSNGHFVFLNNNGDGTFSVFTYIVPGEVILDHYDGGEVFMSSVYVQPETYMAEGDE